MCCGKAGLQCLNPPLRRAAACASSTQRALPARSPAKEIDKLVDVAKTYGAKGLAYTP